jgi:periplasmic protein TonB
MKLDIFKNHWLDIVFEGRNKSYGAYDLRKSNSKVSFLALAFGALVFALGIGAPMISNLFKANETNEDDLHAVKVTQVKLPPKKKIVEPIIEKPKPPPSKVEIKAFVKPVITKAADADKDPPPPPPPNVKTGLTNVKADPNANLAPPDPGPPPGPPGGDPEPDPNAIFNLAGIEQKPEFPGGIEKFYGYVGKTFQVPEEEGLKGRVIVSFVVEKDGSLTDIKVLRDLGFGTGAEAIRVLKKCPKWLPGEQNGKKVRVLYSLPISIESAE